MEHLVKLTKELSIKLPVLTEDKAIKVFCTSMIWLLEAPNYGIVNHYNDRDVLPIVVDLYKKWLMGEKPSSKLVDQTIYRAYTVSKSKTPAYSVSHDDSNAANAIYYAARALNNAKAVGLALSYAASATRHDNYYKILANQVVVFTVPTAPIEVDI